MALPFSVETLFRLRGLLRISHKRAEGLDSAETPGLTLTGESCYNERNSRTCERGRNRGMKKGHVQICWESPLGVLRIAMIEEPGEPARCIGLYFPDHQPEPQHWHCECETLDWQGRAAAKDMVSQLQRYFVEPGHRIQIPYRLMGTEFQNRVWRQLSTIPSGVTRSYREVAEAIGRPRAVRAVGAAIARNPLSIIVPCHRVVSASGSLAGFAGGLDRKRFLLDHESRSGRFVFADSLLQPTSG